MSKPSASELLETSLYLDGFFTYEGLDGWKGAIRAMGLKALNWKQIDPDKWQILFFYQAGQPIQVDLNRENFNKLVSYISS